MTEVNLEDLPSRAGQYTIDNPTPHESVTKMLYIFAFQVSVITET